jgi:aspartyl-tRNA(Asn)/glutamyl-tRNA(Gln) amidotransferase subunit A
VLGCLARSARAGARDKHLCAGYDPLDPASLPKRDGWEQHLGTHDLAGKRVAVVPGLGGVALEAGVEDRVRVAADELIAANGMKQVDLRIELPNMAAYWMIGNLATLLAELGGRWPRCAGQLTDEIATGLYISQSLYNLRTAATSERLRLDAYHAMARAFDDVDFIIAATNPGPAFAADAAMSTTRGGIVDWVREQPLMKLAFRGGLGVVRAASVALPALPSWTLDEFARRFPHVVQMGGLTMISNLYGNPAVSIPAGTVDGLPVGMQVLARHHADPLLLDVALEVERRTPWPRTSLEPGSPNRVSHG